MFLKMRKLKEPFGKKASARESSTEKKTHVKSAAELGDALVDDVASLKERVDGRTRDLEVVRDELGQLTNTVEEPVEGGEAVKVKETSIASIESGGKPAEQSVKGTAAKGKDLSVLLGLAGGQEQDDSAKDDGKGLLSDIFDREDEEENSLKGLIFALPDVTAAELFNELQEIEAMIREGR